MKKIPKVKWLIVVISCILMASMIYVTISYKKEGGLIWLVDQESKKIDDNSYKRAKHMEITIEQTENIGKNTVRVLVRNEKNQLLEEGSFDRNVYKYQGKVGKEQMITFELISESETVIRYGKKIKLLLW